MSELWDAYCADMAGRAIVTTMVTTKKALQSRFFHLAGNGVSIADCRAHIEERRQAGIKDWTIYTELGHLRNVLSWSEKHGHLPRGSASYIERPPQPKTEKCRLTRDQIPVLLGGAVLPHVKLYITLIYTFGARTSALLELKWPRVDFVSGLVDLRNPELRRPHKGRAIVKMNGTARAALMEAREGALSEYVIEWAGKPVKRMRRALASAARRAGLSHVNPHMLRHSAATHLAEDGVDMEVIRQFMGHKDIKTTRDIYAIFSPDYLADVAKTLEVGT